MKTLLVLFFSTSICSAVFAQTAPICGALAGRLIDPETGHCESYKNTCQQSDLIGLGFVEMTPGQICLEDMQVPVVVELPVLNNIALSPIEVDCAGMVSGVDCGLKPIGVLEFDYASCHEASLFVEQNQRTEKDSATGRHVVDLAIKFKPTSLDCLGSAVSRHYSLKVASYDSQNLYILQNPIGDF